MAIYHLEAKVVSRGAGRSAVSASAYLSCSRLYNDYDGIQHDYTKKQGLVWQQIFLPEYAPQEWQDREKLWNAVEEVETAKDSRLAREFVVALPIELNREQQIELLQDFIREQFVADGMCADAAIHDTDGHNPHAHILLTVRPLDEQGKWQYKTEKEYLCMKNGEERGFTAAEFRTAKNDGWEKQYPYKVGKKKVYMTPSAAEAQGLVRADKHPKSTRYGRQNPISERWNSEEQLTAWRAAWADVSNRCLECAGREERINHRSNAARGLDEIPTASCLNLASGKLVEPPFSGDFFRICHSGEMWLAGFYGQEDTFAFGVDTNARVITAQGGTFSLLDPVGHLLLTGLDGTLSLYDSKGIFLSTCALPGRYVQSIVWTEELGGYLLLVNDGEGCNRLLFWDIRANTNGENLQTQSLADLQAAPDGMSADASLYERAQSLSDHFGIEIRIADQCETEFTYFSCYPVSDYGPVSAGLDLLEDALSVFPEGFFRQLIYGHIDRVQFQLVGGLAATNGFGSDMSYAAFTDANGSVCKIVLDIYSLSKNTVWHELSHAIDRRLAWDATYRDEALFTEEGWSALNPDGFTYTGEYGSLGTNIQPEWYSYFIDDYSMINATEDRARIFEYAVEDSGTLFRDAPGLIAKLQYYSDCIRDCFDTALWPEITAWEAPLH